MSLYDRLFMAFKGAFCAGLPSLLCLLAICVSTCTAAAIYHVSTGANSFIEAQLSQLGIAGVTVYTGEPISDLKTALTVLEQQTAVRAAMPLVMETGTVRIRDVRRTALLMGVDGSLPEVYQLELLHGRTFTAAEIAAGEPVLLVDDLLAERIYGRSNILGKTLRIGVGSSYCSATVIGVIRSQKGGLEQTVGLELPEILYIPLNSLTALTGKRSVTKIALSCADGEEPEAVAASAVRLLDLQTGQKFKYENISGYYELAGSVVRVAGGAIFAIGAVAVLVGGLGLMIAMLSAVDRRRQIIGIYMALGASGPSIIGLFLLEAVLLSLAGSAAGTAMALSALKTLQSLLDVTVNRDVLCAVALLAAAAGGLFGILPAVRAARLDPIQVLRD